MGDGGIGYHIPFDQWPEELKKVFSYDPEGAESPYGVLWLLWLHSRGSKVTTVNSG